MWREQPAFPVRVAGDYLWERAMPAKKITGMARSHR